MEHIWQKSASGSCVENVQTSTMLGGCRSVEQTMRRSKPTFCRMITAGEVICYPARNRAIRPMYASQSSGADDFLQQEDRLEHIARINEVIMEIGKTKHTASSQTLLCQEYHFCSFRMGIQIRVVMSNPAGNFFRWRYNGNFLRCRLPNGAHFSWPSTSMEQCTKVKRGSLRVVLLYECYENR